MSNTPLESIYFICFFFFLFNLALPHNESPNAIFLVKSRSSTTSTLWSLHTIANHIEEFLTATSKLTFYYSRQWWRPKIQRNISVWLFPSPIYGSKLVGCLEQWKSNQSLHPLRFSSFIFAVNLLWGCGVGVRLLLLKIWGAPSLLSIFIGSDKCYICW